MSLVVAKVNIVKKIACDNNESKIASCISPPSLAFMKSIRSSMAAQKPMITTQHGCILE